MVTRMKHPATQLLQPVTTGLTVAYLYGSPPLLALTLRALAKRLVAGFRRIGKRFTNGRQGAGQGGGKPHRTRRFDGPNRCVGAASSTRALPHPQHPLCDLIRPGADSD
jgi:hypothetical protein